MKYRFLLGAILFAAAGQVAFAQQHSPAAKSNKPERLITYPCAIVISPTLRQIDSMKKEDGVGYDTIIDDDVYYQSQSSDFIDSVKLKKIEKYATGVLTFRTRDSKVFTVNLAKYTFAVILFNGKTKPVEADIADFAASYKACMK